MTSCDLIGVAMGRLDADIVASECRYLGVSVFVVFINLIVLKLL
jgi:hypothetical protein